MIESSGPEIATDLVEYLVLTVPGQTALPGIREALLGVMTTAAVRILDIVVVTVDEDGSPSVVPASADDTPDVLEGLMAPSCVLLSTHDISLVALALRPGDCAVVLVAEDRWAAPLAAAVHALGGALLAGERIAAERVEEALRRGRWKGADDDIDDHTT